MITFLDPPKVLAIRDVLRTSPKDTPILEVGFGRGEFLSELVKSGYKDIIATETSRSMIDKARKRFESKVSLIAVNDTSEGADWKEWNGRKLTFCFEVIEHLQNPLALLSNLPKGLLYLSTPNPNRWWVKITGQYESWDYPPNHIWRLGDNGKNGHLNLRSLLKAAGYTSIEMHSHPIRYDWVFQPITTYLAYKLGIKTNSENYDDVRSNKLPIGGIYRAVRRLSFPLTFPIATVLNKLGYVGESWYVKAVKE